MTVTFGTIASQALEGRVFCRSKQCPLHKFDLVKDREIETLNWDVNELEEYML